MVRQRLDREHGRGGLGLTGPSLLAIAHRHRCSPSLLAVASAALAIGSAALAVGSAATRRRIRRPRRRIRRHPASDPPPSPSDPRPPRVGSAATPRRIRRPRPRYVPDFARSSSDRRLSSRFAAYCCALCSSTPRAPSLRVRRYASCSHSMSMRWASVVNAMSGRSSRSPPGCDGGAADNHAARAWPLG